MNARVNEIAAMIRARLDAGRLPMEIDASAYADRVELIRNFVLRMRTAGELVSQGGGRIETIKQFMPDMHFIDTWLSVGEAAIVVKFTIAGTLPNGEANETPYTEIFHVTNGRVDRLDLYSCPSQEQKAARFLTGNIPGFNTEATGDLEITQVYPEPIQRPVIAQKGPYAVEVEPGKIYWWCRCGRSKSQPICDGSHLNTGLFPMKFSVDEKKTVYFCGCKHSHHAPLCDGEHNRV